MESIDTPFLPPGLQVQALTAKGVDQAQRLVVEASWNQTPQDWFTFLELGQAYQVTTSEGEVVATAATLPYPPHSGWISMVLVSQKHRRQGIASALLALCIQTLRSANLAPWLDATRQLLKRLKPAVRFITRLDSRTECPSPDGVYRSIAQPWNCPTKAHGYAPCCHRIGLASVG